RQAALRRGVVSRGQTPWDPRTGPPVSPVTSHQTRTQQGETGIVSKLRIGVVGAGNISKYHLKAYAAHDETELVAIADINADRAQSVADEWGARRSYGDAAELFADPDVDAVSICTWNDSHAQLAIQAVEAGKHVLLEKPMSTSHAEADRLGTVAAASDRIVQM